MEDYTSNSHAAKEQKKEREKHKPLVNASLKKRSWWSMVLDGDINSIKSRVINEVVVPIAKNTLDTVITQTSHVIFGGKPFDARNLPASNIKYITDYQGASRRNTVPNQVTQPSPTLGTVDYNRVRYPNEAAAKTVLDAMRGHIAQYEFVTVGDLYDLAGLPNSPTDYNYGWTDVSSAIVYQALDGCYIKWPKAMAIK